MNRCDFALVTMLGLLGLRILEATGSDIEDLGEKHGHRVLRVHGKGDWVVLVPLPPAVGRAIERAIDERTAGTSWPRTWPPAPDGSSGRRIECVSGLKALTGGLGVAGSAQRPEYPGDGLLAAVRDSSV
jgi:hypothetical protein